jgi:hypothetical protein
VGSVVQELSDEKIDSAEPEQKLVHKSSLHQEFFDLLGDEPAPRSGEQKAPAGGNNKPFSGGDSSNIFDDPPYLKEPVAAAEAKKGPIPASVFQRAQPTDDGDIITQKAKKLSEIFGGDAEKYRPFIVLRAEKNVSDLVDEYLQSHNPN